MLFRQFACREKRPDPFAAQPTFDAELAEPVPVLVNSKCAFDMCLFCFGERKSPQQDSGTFVVQTQAI